MAFALTLSRSRLIGRLGGVVLLVQALAAAGASAAPATKTGPAPTDFRGDLKIVQQFLDNDKSYSPAERAEAEAALAKLKTRAANMTAAAFQLAVAHIAALTHNGHTMLVPGLWAFQFKRIPLRFHLFADGLYVIHAPAGMHNMLGARVISIDGHRIDGLKRIFARYYGGYAPKRNQWIGLFLESPALLHAAGVAKSDTGVQLNLRLQSGARIKRPVEAKMDPPSGRPLDFVQKPRLVEFAAENTKSVPLYLAEPKKAFRLAALPKLHAYYVQLRANVSINGQKIDAFETSALATLRKAKPQNLVVDLRFDGGGDLNTTRDFLQALPTLIPEDGRIFALSSGWTFSAGIASLGYLKQAGKKRVTIVGEPIGDHLEFWAEGNIMKLPVSKAVMLYANGRHNYMTGCPEPDCHESIRKFPIRVTTLQPDILVPLTYADYRAGRDRTLEAVSKALKRQ